MGRVFSKKSVNDVETAAESIILNDLGSNTLKKINDGTSKLSVSANMHSSPPFDDFTEKRT